MDCGCDPEYERDPICDDDPALGTNDELAGYLNRLVDQSITDLIEEDNTLGEFKDEESPLPDFKNQKKKPSKEFSSSKSLPSLDLKKMDGIPKASPQTLRTSSLPSVKRKPSPVRLDLDLRRNTLIRQYRKAMVESYVNHVPVIREEPETSSRRVTAADLAPDPPSKKTAAGPAPEPSRVTSKETAADPAPEPSRVTSKETAADPAPEPSRVTSKETAADPAPEPSHVTSKETAADPAPEPSRVTSKETAADPAFEPSCVTSKETANNMDDDLDDEIGDFVSESLSSITRGNALHEETLDDQVDYFINRSLMAVVDETASMLAMEEMEKELYRHNTNHSLVPTSVSVTSKAERDMEKELHHGESCNQRIAKTSTVSKAEREMEKEFCKDEEGCSVQCAPTSIFSEEKKDVSGIKESLVADMAKTTVDAKASSQSVFGFIFKRRRSKGSLKLRFPCLRLVCCTTTQETDEDRDVPSDLNSRQTKKPGLLKRLFPFLRKRSARVAPLVTEC